MHVDESRDLGSALQPQGQEGPERPERRELVASLSRLALGAAWTARHPREPYVAAPADAPRDRLYYQAEDGWEAPLWRHPPRAGASGEPVLLVHGLATGTRCFDYQEEGSLAAALVAAGFDVYLMEHRGDRHSVAPPGAPPFDFDDIAAFDVPAALATVRRVSGFPRVLWVGHAMGGQLLYAHLARGGGPDLAAAASLCAAVRFSLPRSQARLAALAAHLLPAAWSVPTRVVQQALSALAEPDLWAPLTSDAEGPLVRGHLLHASEDVHAGLARQVARWLSSGWLCDRHDRLDYVEAMRGQTLPVFVVAAEGDRVCPPEAARPAFDVLNAADRRWLALGEGWGHLDPLLGRAAAAELFPALVAWLSRWRRACW